LIDGRGGSQDPPLRCGRARRPATTRLTGGPEGPPLRDRRGGGEAPPRIAT
jgi:hypothetical protein